MNKIALVFGLIGLVFFVVSCNKDLDVYAPYDSTTIVTGVLDPSVDTQFVRINRTWQGEGNNLDYAAIRDSSEYQWDEFNSIVVEEIFNGSVTNTWDLQEIEKSDKSTDGIFYGPEYTAYYFVNENEFLSDRTYRLKVDFKNKVDISSETTVITADGGSVTTPNENSPENYTIRFADVFGGNSTYVDFVPKWNPYSNAARYDVSLRIHFTEKLWNDVSQTELVSETEKVLTWNVGSVDADTPLANGKHQTRINGERFYTFLSNQLEANPLISRELGTYQESTQTNYVFDFVLSIANEDLDLFLEINEPVTNIIQERPQFTNISNGLGIFASRVSIVLPGVGLKSLSEEELVEGDYTQELNFCSSYFLSDFFCDE